MSLTVYDGKLTREKEVVVKKPYFQLYYVATERTCPIRLSGLAKAREGLCHEFKSHEIRRSFDGSGLFMVSLTYVYHHNIMIGKLD